MDGMNIVFADGHAKWFHFDIPSGYHETLNGVTWRIDGTKEPGWDVPW